MARARRPGGGVRDIVRRQTAARDATFRGDFSSALRRGSRRDLTWHARCFQPPGELMGSPMHVGCCETACRTDDGHGGSRRAGREEFSRGQWGEGRIVLRRLRSPQHRPKCGREIPPIRLAKVVCAGVSVIVAIRMVGARCIAPSDAGESGAGESRVAEVGIGEVGAVEVGVGEVASFEAGVG